MKKVLFFTSLLFLLWACSKDKNIISDRDDQSIPTTTGARSLPPRDTVHISGSGFSPESMKTIVDNAVTWVNDDNATHTITSGTFDSGDIPGGGLFSHVFHNPGTYSYYCKYHPEKGSVVVPGGVQ